MEEFKVSEERRKIWNLELQIFDEFDRICKKYHLRYFFIGGSLLGAIRHNGFIPWDDDIDISMFREDYEKFLEIGKHELPSELRIQTNKTDKDFFYGHAKIRNINTTAIRKIDWEAGASFNQGIFIDIFPLDSIPDNRFAEKIHCNFSNLIHKMVKRYTYYKGYEKHTIRTKLIYSLCKCVLSFVSLQRLYDFFEKYIQKYNNQNTKMIGHLSEYYGIKTEQWPRDYFSDTVDHVFQDRQVSISTNYLKILNKTFGEWKKPLRDAPTDHGTMFFDTERPFSYYMIHKEEVSFNQTL